jgi:hypothetical protein
MTIKRPTMEQLRDIVTDLGMSLSAERLEEFHVLMENSIASYDVVEALPDEKPRVKYPRARRLFALLAAIEEEKGEDDHAVDDAAAIFGHVQR